MGKAIIFLHKVYPHNEFWDDTEGLANISGEKFRRACQRSLAKKDASYGQKSKVGLNRKARNVGVVDLILASLESLLKL